MKRFFPVLVALFPAALPAAVVASFDFTSTTEGWTATNTSGFAATTGNLVGTAINNDPQFYLNPTVITRGASETWTTIEFRVREFDDVTASYITSYDGTGVVFQVTGTGGILVNAPASFVGVASGNNYFTVTADISGITASTITNLRLDPIGGSFANSGSETSGNSFEVDYIRISDSSVIPEPALSLLGGLAALGLLLRRR